MIQCDIKNGYHDLSWVVYMTCHVIPSLIAIHRLQEICVDR
jgi:hypothetical protein